VGRRRDHLRSSIGTVQFHINLSHLPGAPRLSCEAVFVSQPENDAGCAISRGFSREVENTITDSRNGPLYPPNLPEASSLSPQRIPWAITPCPANLNGIRKAGNGATVARLLSASKAIATVHDSQQSSCLPGGWPASLHHVFFLRLKQCRVPGAPHPSPETLFDSQPKNSAGCPISRGFIARSGDHDH
jgi:hypothetical protein